MWLLSKPVYSPLAPTVHVVGLLQTVLAVQPAPPILQLQLLYWRSCPWPVFWKLWPPSYTIFIGDKLILPIFYDCNNPESWIIVKVFIKLYIIIFYIFFSSPEPKGSQLLNRNLSVVCRHLYCCHYGRRLFTFSSFSHEPLDQFKPNLKQSILGWNGFNFLIWRAIPIPNGDNCEIVRIHDNI